MVSPRSPFWPPRVAQVGHALGAGTLCCAFAVSACSHAPAGGTWETAKETRRLSSAPADLDDTARTASTRSVVTRTAPPPADATSGRLIDGALQEFLSTRATSRGARDRDILVGRAWLSVLEAIDSACTVAPTSDDLGAFVRARATLEVELHRDRSRALALPRDVETRLEETLASVDMRMSELRALNTPGMLRPTPLPDGGIVVLLPPVSPLVVSSPFGVRTDPIHGRTRFHAGVDFSAPFGAPVHAAASGSVVYAGWQGGYGKHVVVDHGGGLRTHYSHLHKITVRSGMKVGPGDTLGVVGATGRATGPHLHFAVTNLDGAFLDPSALVNQPFYAAPPEETPVASADAATSDAEGSFGGAPRNTATAAR